MTVQTPPVQAEDVFLVEPADTSQTTTKDQRISQRKTELKAQISEQSLKTLAQKCKKVQKTIAAIKTKDEKALIIRHDFYTSSANKLNYIVDNLKKQNISSTALEAAGQPFGVAVNKYLSDARAYKAAIDDLASMDCTKDTTGFRATILSAQQLRAQLASDVATIKNTFTQIKAAVEQAKTKLPKADG
ncbi:hypothetical protein HY857_02160 [Candidatus Saccharibacteria bacterium]|nr:hypothetical protein [Candidatus Saccharibacteria bacterium]